MFGSLHIVSLLVPPILKEPLHKLGSNDTKCNFLKLQKLKKIASVASDFQSCDLYPSSEFPR